MSEAAKENKVKISKEKRSSIIRRLVLLIGLIIVFFNLIQLFCLVNESKKAIIRENMQIYNNMIEGYTAALQNDIESYYCTLNGYVNADIMAEGNLEKVFEWITDSTNHKNLRGSFDYVMITGPNGKARTDMGSITDINERDYFQAIMKEGKERFVDNPVIGKTTGKPVIHVSTPLKDRNGRKFAMVTGVVNLSNLTSHIAQIKIGENGFGFLLASSGQVIAHPNEELIMKTNFVTDLDANGPFGDMAAAAKNMSEGKSGEAWYVLRIRREKILLYTLR